MRRGRRRVYPPALFVILMVMKATLNRSNNGVWKALRGVIKLPPPFDRMNPGRRTIDRGLSGNDKMVEAFLNRVMWRLILKLTSSPKAAIIDSTELVADPRKEKEGSWGHNSKGRFYGYKLHLISTENSIPIGFKV